MLKYDEMFWKVTPEYSILIFPGSTLGEKHPGVSKEFGSLPEVV
jgi:hypothetical protein